MKTRLLLAAAASLAVAAQAPMLQDGAVALRQARLDWALGQAPLPPSSLPSFEVGWGGADADGAYLPLTGGEGMGQGSRGWGLGLQGRMARDGWSFAATVLALRDQGRTLGSLQRLALAYQTESGWRAALEQAPFAWGSGLNGGDLLGDAARPFPRLTLATPEVALSLSRWRLEAFVGRLEGDRPIPAWIPDRDARLEAQAAGLDLARPLLWGGLVRASFASVVEATFGTLLMTGGEDTQGHTAPGAAARATTLVELRARLPRLADLFGARGASLYASRSAAPESRAITLAPSRDLGGLQLVWETWDLALEYAGATPTGSASFTEPSYLAGWSTHGDPLQSASPRQAITRTLELGLPLFLEGRGRLKVLRLTADQNLASADAAWILQADAQWRTPTGRLGASVASQRVEMPASASRWGWTFTVFQSFRVF